MSNRIERSIREISAKLAAEPNLITPDLEEAGSLDFADWFALGDKASVALMHGIISQDEAMTLYSIHGETYEHWQSQSLARRLTYVLTSPALLTAARQSS